MIDRATASTQMGYAPIPEDSPWLKAKEAKEIAKHKLGRTESAYELSKQLEDYVAISFWIFIIFLKLGRYRLID